jgi:hypothetical protein
METIKNNSHRAEQVILILKIIIIFDILMILFDGMELNLLFRLKNGLVQNVNALKQNNFRQWMISIFYTTVSLSSGIAFLMWFYRVYENIEQSGIRTDRSKIWAIWGFIIPVVNFYMPYLIMKEINVKMSERIFSTTGKIRDPQTRWITLWWILWLCSIGTSLFYFILLMKERNIYSGIRVSALSIFFDLIDIPAALITIIVIQKTRATERLFLRQIYNTD